MAIELKNPVTRSDIEYAIHLWFNLLANEQYSAAFDFTLQDSYYQWTPEVLEQVINGYGLLSENDGTPKCKVTNWLTAIDTNNRNHYKEIDLFDRSASYSKAGFVQIGYVYYDMPLDGEWSDLTATFKIIQSPDFTTLELNEIHVM